MLELTTRLMLIKKEVAVYKEDSVNPNQKEVRFLLATPQ